MCIWNPKDSVQDFDITSIFAFPTQINAMHVCCMLHGFILTLALDDPMLLLPEDELLSDGEEVEQAFYSQPESQRWHRD